MGYLGEGGVIQNLTVEGDVTGHSNVGGVCGHNYAGTILNCRYSGAVAGNSLVGGICGQCRDGTIQNCQNSGTVTNQNSSSGTVGGICGQTFISSTGSTIENCLNTGAVTTSGTAGNAGGICGINNNSTIENCLNTGDVSATGDNGKAGGICGQNYSTVTNCYWLEGTCGKGIGGGSGEATAKTETELASGAVAYLLNNKSTDEEATPWRQNLDNDKEKDLFPVLDAGHGIVYQAGAGDYSNTKTGSAEAPYEIDDAEDLAAFRDAVNSGDTDAWAVLTADIDLSTVCGEDGSSWTPIGLNSENAYTGTFDGGGHTIERLYINSEATYAGLFGVVGEDGTVKNLTVAGEVTGGDGSEATYTYIYTGGVAGQNHGTIADCSFNGTVIAKGDNTGDESYIYTGGVVGENAVGGAVKNCRNNGTVIAKGDNTDAESYIGGLVGENDGTVADCCNTGAVTGSSGFSFFPIGGVVGFNVKNNDANDSGTITNCCNTGAVTGTVTGAGDKSLTGGVVGYNGGGTVTNCRSSGAVTSNAGDSRTGGVAGDSTGGTIENCYNTGAVTGSSGQSSNTAGVVGFSGAYNTIKNCYNTGAVSSTAGSTGGVAGDTAIGGTIENCYNIGAVTGNSTYTGGVAGRNHKDGTIRNCYYLTGEDYPGTGIGEDNADASQADGKEEGSFESGEVAYLLGGEDAGKATSAWRQNLGGDTADRFPVLDALDPGHGIVYQTEDGSYSNDPPAAPEQPSSGGGSPAYRPDVEQPEGGQVSVSPSRPEQGSTVTITPEPDEGYGIGQVTVTDWNGNQVEVTENGDGTFSFTQPAGQVTIAVTFLCDGGHLCVSAHFTDVDLDAWYHPAMDYAVERGLMEGTSATTFSPEAATTRAQLVTILWRLEGSPVVNYLMDYEDVSGDAWYAEAVRWAAGEGIAVGYGNGYFGPGDVILREQLAVMLYRYALHEGMDTATQEENLWGYSDGDSVSGYALQAMNWAVGAGIINGTGEAQLSPQAGATRAQAAAMLVRFCERYGEIEG